MLCRATERRFWNGVMVGPDTGNDFVNYLGKEKDMPKDFEPMTDEKIAAEEESKAALINRQKELSKGLAIGTPVVKESLPESGGGTNGTKEDEEFTADQVAEAIRTGTVPSKPDSEHEASDQSRVETDEKGNPIEPDSAIEK